MQNIHLVNALLDIYLLRIRNVIFDQNQNVLFRIKFFEMCEMFLFLY